MLVNVNSMHDMVIKDVYDLFTYMSLHIKHIHMYACALSSRKVDECV